LFTNSGSATETESILVSKTDRYTTGYATGHVIVEERRFSAALACRVFGLQPPWSSFLPRLPLRPRSRHVNPRRINRNIPLNLHLQRCPYFQLHIRTMLQ